MIYVKRDSLTIIEIQNGINHISLHTLKEIILNSPSNVIYFEEGGNYMGLSVWAILREPVKAERVMWHLTDILRVFLIKSI